MILRLTLETDIPPGLEQAWKESIAMDAEKMLGQAVRVVRIETREEERRRRADHEDH